MDQFGTRLDRLESNVEQFQGMLDVILEEDVPMPFCHKCQARRHRHGTPCCIRDVVGSNSPTTVDLIESKCVPIKRRFSKAKDYRQEMRRHLARPTGVMTQDMPTKVETAPEGVACEYYEGPHRVLECLELKDIYPYDVEEDGGAEGPATYGNRLDVGRGEQVYC